MTKLSPAAQRVQFATFRVYDEEEHLYVVPAEKHAGMIAAAAIRAAADQVVPPEQETPWGSVVQAHAAELRIRNELLAIADELEAQ